MSYRRCVVVERRLVLIVAVIACGLVWATVAPASAADGVRLSGTAGWAGKCHNGRAVIVQARIEADRLVSGVLSVEANGPSAAAEVPVEVAGGTDEDVLLVTNAPHACSGTLSLRLRESGSTTTSQVPTSAAGGTVLLGLLPGARTGEVKVSVKGRTGPAAAAALDPGVLDLPGALEGLDSIGATGGDLDGLSAAQADALAVWVAAGGNLLVDAGRPDELGALPEAWRPAPGGRVEAGRGQVRLTGTALRDGAIDGLAEPSAGLSLSEPVFSGIVTTGGGIGTLLRRSSGLRVLSLPLILGALAVYVLVVGPGVRIGLRRSGRLQLTWVLVPVIAVVFSGLAVAGGDLLRSGGRATHLSVLHTASAGARGRSVVGVPTRNKQTVTADLPTGWLAGDLGFDAQLGRSTVRATPRGQRLQATGQAGGFVVLGGEGPSTVKGRLEVLLEAEPAGSGGKEEPAGSGGKEEPGSEGRKERRGTVRNEMGVPLEDVAVFTPGGVVGLGRMEVGGTSPFTVPITGEPMDAQFLAQQQWRGPEVRLANADAFSFLADASPLAAGPSIMAAGWTDQLASPVAVRGEHPPGTTLVIGRPESGSLTGEPVAISSENLMTVRFVAPADAAYRLGGVDLRRENDPRTGPRVLIGETWTALDEAQLPAGAAAAGVVYIQIPVRGPVTPTLEPA